MPRMFTRSRLTVAIPARTATLDRKQMARAATASNIHRHPHLARACYANCERAPLDWEKRRG